MPASNHEDRPYGARFAEAWKQLQRYLADLDAEELEQLSRSDLAATLALLKQQPALGHSGALNNGHKKLPEELALAIVQERLSALTSGLAHGAEGKWGARFLEAWRNHGGPVSCFKYAQIQELKAADREGAIKVLRRFVTTGSFQHSRLLNDLTPEAAARELLTRLRMGQLAALAIIF